MIIPNWVAEYIGIPFVDYGRDRDGADCWGLARMIWFDRIGLKLPEFAIDPNRGDLCKIMIDDQIREWFPVENGNECELDGVIMTGCYGVGREMKRAPMHIGVVVAPGVLIHTSEETVFSSLLRYNEQRAKHDIVSFHRHKSIINCRVI